MTLITAGFVALTVSIGQWQLRRADEKRARLDLLVERQRAAAIDLDRDPAAGSAADPAVLGGLRYRRAHAAGNFVAGATILLDNRVRGHVAGFEVITPLRLATSGRVVLVNRGWMPLGADRASAAAPPAPAGPLELDGTLAIPEPLTVAPGDPAWPAPAAAGVIWPRLSLVRFQTATGLPAVPYVLQQTTAAPDGLIREWPGPPDDSATHRAYALQWFSFAAIAAGLYAWGFVRRRRSAA